MTTFRLTILIALFGFWLSGALADQTITFTAYTTNGYVTHLLLGAGGRLTAWQDCPADARNCPRKSTGSYHIEGHCVTTHIDWNMGTYNYPTNGTRKMDGSSC